MEDFSYRFSPKVRDFASTQTTAFTSSHFSSDCNLCPRTAPHQKEDLTVTDLKREYSKAMNCIEILKLEKKNLQDALSFTKDFKKDKTEKYFVSSTKSTAAPSPKGDFRPMKSVDGDRRVVELEQELLEQRRLYDRISAQNEQLRQENYTYRERMEQNDDFELQNHQLKNDIKELTEELRKESKQVYELQKENDQLLDRRAQLANSARKLPPKELYKYLDHVYELIGTLNRNHYAHYHFRECFIDESNIETLLEEKESNQVLVQAFRYITNLLVNINSSVGSSVDQRRPSQTVLTDSGSMNQGRIERRDQTTSYNILGNSSNNLQYSVQEEVDAPMYPPNPTPNLNNSKNLNLNAVSREIDAVQPHSFGDAAPLSQQDLGIETRNQSNHSKVYSPSNSRYVASNSYSNKANTDMNTTARRLELSRNPSAKSGVSGVSASPNNRRNKSPTSNKHAASVNALNVSKQSIARSHVSQRTAAHQNSVEANAALNASRVSQRTAHQNAVEANAALNASRQSQGKSFVSQKTVKQNANATAAEINALNASRVSQAKSKVSHHTTRQNIVNNNDEEQQYYTERAGNPRSMNYDLEDREMRLRELDRELQEKDRLLQMKEKELKDRSVMDKSMSRYRAQQEEAEINRSALSQSRKLASQKSLTKEKSLHQSKQRLDESRENTRVLKSQTQLKGQSHVDYDRSNVNTNLNKSTSVVVQSRIIPSMSSLNDVDVSPKAFGVSPKHGGTQPVLKSLTRVGNSVQSIDPYSEFQRSPKNFSAVNSQKVLGVASAYDVDGTSVSRMGPQRTAFQEAFNSAQSFENSPQSKISPKPQTLERLENSGIKLIDQRGGEDYEENSQIYDGNQIYDPTPIHMASPHSDHTRRHITFDTRNLGEIEECESSPQSKSLSRKMSLGERSGGKQGTEYASFRVSFGRTQSKYLRSQSPDLDAKDSLYIVDVARRKRVTHHEQTYDVVQGNEVRYDLNSLGPDYGVSKQKPRSKYEPRDQSSENLDRSQQMASPPCTNRVEQ